MSWARLDDDFFDNPKIAALSDAAQLALVKSIVYSARNLTDGFVPDRKTKEYASTGRVIKELIPALWEPCEGGVQVHDYLDYNPSKEQVLREREIARRRFAMNSNPEMSKAVRARDGDHCRYCGVAVNWADRKSPVGGTYDHVVPLSKGGDETVDNLVTCCRQCNSRKGAKTLDQAGISLIPVQNQNGIKLVSK